MNSADSNELIVVTGASTGMGAATARELARKGFHVLAGVRREADAVARALAGAVSRHQATRAAGTFHMALRSSGRVGDAAPGREAGPGTAYSGPGPGAWPEQTGAALQLTAERTPPYTTRALTSGRP